MNNAIQILEKDRNRADIFFDTDPVFTDWDTVRRAVTEGKITSAGMLVILKNYEPLQDPDSRDHAHWVDQQLFRLALLHETGKNLESEKICERCASRKADYLFAEKFNVLCLHCEEEERQALNTGGRGSCEFLRPYYNPRSHSWGLLYYWSHGRDSRFLFWLADFFKTRKDAEAAMRPINRYDTWLNLKYGGLYHSWRSFSDLLPLNKVMKLALPLTPEQFREHLRTAIETDMNQEHQLMEHRVEEAMKKHERKEDDDD